MTPLPARARPAGSHGAAQFRYSAVLVIVLALPEFEVLAPDTDRARAFAPALAGAALAIAVGTSPTCGSVRQARALVVSGAAAVVVIGIAVGALGTGAPFPIGTLLACVHSGRSGGD